jgi:hypothetical protein
MRLKCTKNLVLSGQLIIMKHDVIKILDSDTVEKLGADSTCYFDCVVEVSSMHKGMEFSMNIYQLAEHFEYLEVVTKHTTMTYV